MIMNRYTCSRLYMAAAVLLLLCGVGLLWCRTSLAAQRQKSTVLLVFNNQAKKYYDEKLNEIAWEELHKRVDGLYTVADNKEVLPLFTDKSHFGTKLPQFLENTKGVRADYLVYTELMPYHWSENYNVIWHTKKMTATMGLRIVDLKKRQELCSRQYSVESRDETDAYFIGNPSMAKKSLKAVLFKVGEAISVNLPL